MTTISLGALQGAMLTIAANPGPYWSGITSGIGAAANNLANGLSNSAETYRAIGESLANSARTQANMLLAYPPASE